MSGFLTLTLDQPTEWTDQTRDAFLREHVDQVYDELTDGLARPLRDQELLAAAAERFPGLVPGSEELAAEGERRLADKQGAELAQGIFLSHVLASPHAGSHLRHGVTILRLANIAHEWGYGRGRPTAQTLTFRTCPPRCAASQLAPHSR